MQLGLPLEEIRALCESYPIQKLSLFGSALRGEMHAESDVDLLVEYEPEAKVTYLDMAEQEMALTDLIGRRVELRTPAELSRYFRQKVVETAQIIYERT